MRKKSTDKILHDYFDAQQSNFIQHLQRQEQNFMDHLKILEDLFSDNSNNDFNRIQENLESHNKKLENNLKNENNNFKNKIDAQKRKTNNLLARTNIYIPYDNDNNNINLHNRNNRIRNNSNYNRPKEYVDKNLEFKKSKAISALPVFQFKYIVQYEKRHEKTCPICLTDFKPDNILIRFSCKEHIFHQNCLLKWLEKSSLCPLCKKSLFIK